MSVAERAKMSTSVLEVLRKYAPSIARAIASRGPTADLIVELQEVFAERVREERIETLEEDLALLAAQIDDLGSFHAHVLAETDSQRAWMKEVVERDPDARRDLPTDPFVEACVETLRGALLDLPRNAAFAKGVVRHVGRSFSDQETMRVVRPDVRRTVARTLFPNAHETTGLRIGDPVPEWRRWKLLKPLGRGGFGEVWLARYDEIQREVAIKFCEDEGKARQLEREIQAVRSLTHPNIVPLVEADLHAIPPWIAFEYVPGGTLTEWIRARRRSRVDILARLEEILLALVHAHEHGVWHRDVKPDNVLIDASGKAKLTDFGIGKVNAQERQELVSRDLGPSITISGTTPYMPPEVLNAQKPADARADVYAFGVLAWQLFLGDPTRVLSADWMEDLREAGAERHEPFLRRCLASHDRRFEHAGEAWEAFAGIRSSAAEGVSPPACVPAQPRGTIRAPAPLPSVGEGRTFEVPGTGIALAMIFCPPGTFLMGSPEGDEEGFDRERPRHQVELTQGFWLGKTPVTQAQYEAITGNNPSTFEGTDHPVETLSHDEAVTFAKEIAQKEGGPWRLPTEAEWEYACRAGNEASRHGALDAIAWHAGNSREETHPVARKEPNAWGFYDTLGNVWEWVQDWFGDYQPGVAKDPMGPQSGMKRVHRGGSAWFDHRFCRAPVRAQSSPGGRGKSVGFRLARPHVPLEAQRERSVL